MKFISGILIVLYERIPYFNAFTLLYVQNMYNWLIVTTGAKCNYACVMYS